MNSIGMCDLPSVYASGSDLPSVYASGSADPGCYGGSGADGYSNPGFYSGGGADGCGVPSSQHHSMSVSARMYDTPTPFEDAPSRDGGDGSANGEVTTKPIDHQYICRGLVCAAAAIISVIGAVVCVFGAYASFAAPWLPGVFGSSRGMMPASIGSFASGIVIFVFALIGCVGSYRRSKVWLFILLRCWTVHRPSFRAS